MFFWSKFHHLSQKLASKPLLLVGLACYSQTWKMCTQASDSELERKFHSRVLSSIPPSVSSAHFHMIVQKILQLCKEMIFTSGIPNEDCVGKKEQWEETATTNHFQSSSKEKLLKVKYNYYQNYNSTTQFSIWVCFVCI